MIKKKEIFFPENMHYLLYRHRLSGAELAKRLKISRSTVAAWTSGRAYPRMETMLEIMGVFDIGLDALMFSNLKSPAYKSDESSTGVSMAAETSPEYAKLKSENDELSRRLEVLEKQMGIDPRHKNDTRGKRK